MNKIYAFINKENETVFLIIFKIEYPHFRLFSILLSYNKP